MIDTFLSIVDNLVKLTQLKFDFDRKAFENHIDPIYKDLRVIVDDYHAILKDTMNKLQESDFSLVSSKNIISLLIERRLEYARTRDEIKRYSKVLKASNYGNDIQEFAVATFNLLTAEPVTAELIENLTGKPLLRITTATSSLISDLTRILITPNAQRGALSLVKHYRKEIDRRWDIVSQCYFELRTKYLK